MSLAMCVSPSSPINALHNESYIKSRIFGARRPKVLILKAARVLFRAVYNACKTRHNNSRDTTTFNLFTFYFSNNEKT